jgi:hypothetical protein
MTNVPPAPAPGGNDTPPPPETPPVWDTMFAIIAAIVIGVASGLVLSHAIDLLGDLKSSDLTAPKTGPTALAAALSLPLTIVGGFILSVGTWMAAVEWRGRFKPPKPPNRKAVGVPIDLSSLAGAIGKLKGAPLVLFIGAVLMLGSAWVAHSSAGAADPAASAGPTGPSGSSGESGPSGATGGSGPAGTSTSPGDSAPTGTS